MTPKPAPQYQATHTPERHHECPGRQKLQMALLFVSEIKTHSNKPQAVHLCSREHPATALLPNSEPFTSLWPLTLP